MKNKTNTVLSFLKKHKFFFLGIAGVGVACLVGANVDSVFAADMFDPGRDLPEAVDNAGGDLTLREGIMQAINWILGFVGILAVIMLIWGGFQYMFSQGEETEKARNTIIYSIVGILIIVFSFAIIQTVFDVSSGGDGDSGGLGN